MILKILDLHVEDSFIEFVVHINAIIQSLRKIVRLFRKLLTASRFHFYNLCAVSILMCRIKFSLKNYNSKFYKPLPHILVLRIVTEAYNYMYDSMSALLQTGPKLNII